MTREIRDDLEDMLEYARKAQGFVGAMTWEQFRADEKTQFATTRALEIIGEVARQLPSEFQARFPAVPWQRIIGMRNILAHNYDATDPRIIYDTVTIFVPQLIEKLPAIILAAENPEQSGQ